jgi:transglutaminase-like putative cysteine protease
MRLKIRHQTFYQYDIAAASAVQILRLTPRSHEGQFVQKWRVEIDADCKLDRGEDAFGNIVHTFSVDGPIHAMMITAEGELDMADTGGSLKGTTEYFPLGLWLRETRLTKADPAIKVYARHHFSSEGGQILATLHALMRAINTDFSFMVGETDATTTATEAFASKKGVCQDLAHVFVACARSLGIPARYAGGYYLRTDKVEQDAGHAWAEVHVNGLGWIGFDPANGLCTTDRHVRVAIGADYLDAAPIRGSRIGGTGEKLKVMVDVREGQRIIIEN